MPHWKTLEDRLADQKKSRQKLAERLQKVAAKHEKVSIGCQPSEIVDEESAKEDQVSSSPWKKVRISLDASRSVHSALDGQALGVQPWAKDLINVVLEAADVGGIHLCLLWPVRIDSLAILHALANIERNFAHDLRGLRTILFPGSYTARLALQATLIRRSQFSDLYKTLWQTRDRVTAFSAYTRSSAFEAALDALTEIEIWNSEVDDPSLAALVPCFIYDESHHGWLSTGQSQLDVLLRKIPRLSNRRDIREKISSEWSEARKAPCALMVLHNSATRKTWKEALASPSLQNSGRPELFLINATSLADQANFRSVRRIPDFLRFAADNGYSDVGAVVVTDDPKTFFILRARLNELRLRASSKVWAAEGDQALLSTKAESHGWTPQQRSNANFSIGIVDRDASQVAVTFQRLADDAGSEESSARQAVMAACLYVLRLSNLPAGYRDLTEEAAQKGDLEYGGQRNAWAPINLAIQSVLESGALNAKRIELGKAIAKAEQLIDAWGDATPMASRLLAEVRRYAVDGREGLSIVLPNKNYIQLAHRFLRRRLEEQWPTVEPRLDWNTLSSVGGSFGSKHKGRHFVFVGINRSVLRILITHPDIPHGTTILAAYQQAKTTLTTLKSMKEVDAFKPYRGRIGLLAQELERRIAEVPNPLDIGKLGELKMIFKLEDTAQSDGAGEQEYYRFELEGGGHSFASGSVYRYEPEARPFFRRASAGSIVVGDLIFEMDAELRNKVEFALQLDGDQLASVVYPERTLLKLYHDDVQSRCTLLFGATKRSALAREILAKMILLDSKASECTPGRVEYWLALGTDGDTRPHAPKDAKFFRIFCRALEFGEAEAVQNWNFIRNARRLNQNLGRELSARYAEILFQPESAIAYRKIPQTVINHLQQDALRCVFRVERIVAPSTAV